jgi:hypothetical protein
MPQKDVIHDPVVAALRHDGWTITHEHYSLPVGGRTIYIDIAAERDVIAAERDGEKIAVEVKSFVGRSAVEDLRDAVGQYVLYTAVLQEKDADRMPFLAVDTAVAQGILREQIGKLVLAQAQVNLLIVDIRTRRIVTWNPWTTDNR